MNEDRMRETLVLMGEVAAERVALGTLDSEAQRHTDNLDLFEAMLRTAYPDITMIVAGHHIMYMRAGHPLPFEIPSADALIFDHAVAEAVWGERFRERLMFLAAEPTERRDAVLRNMLVSKTA